MDFPTKLSKKLTKGSRMDNQTLKSYELFAGAKIIGRECSLVNLDFYDCKKKLGNDPVACMDKSNKVKSCVESL